MANDQQLIQQMMAKCPHMSNLPLEEQKQMISIQNKCPFAAEHMSEEQYAEEVKKCPYMNTKDEEQPLNVTDFICSHCNDFLIECVTLAPCKHSHCERCASEEELKCTKCNTTVDSKSRDVFKQYLVDSYVNMLYPSATSRFQYALQQKLPHRAVHYAQSALKCDEYLTEELRGVITGKIGDWYLQLKDFDSAKEFYEKSSDLLSAGDQRESLYITLMKLGGLLLNGMHKIDDAINVYNRACQNAHDTLSLINSTVLLGDALGRAGQHEAARDCYMNALNYTQKMEDSQRLSQIRSWITQRISTP